jgi:hypothetical protein
MKDIFSEIKKANLKQHIAVGGVALALAVAVNTFVFSTDTGLKIQASALEAVGGTSSTSSGQLLADVALLQAKTGTDRVQVQLQKPAKGVKLMEFSLLSDPDKLTFGEISASGAKVVTTSSVPGVIFIRLEYATPQDIAAGSIASVGAIKKGESSVPLNISSPRLVTIGGEYELSSASTIIK